MICINCRRYYDNVVLDQSNVEMKLAEKYWGWPANWRDYDSWRDDPKWLKQNRPEGT